MHQHVVHVLEPARGNAQEVHRVDQEAVVGEPPCLVAQACIPAGRQVWGNGGGSSQYTCRQAGVWGLGSCFSWQMAHDFMIHVHELCYLAYMCS